MTCPLWRMIHGKRVKPTTWNEIFREFKWNWLCVALTSSRTTHPNNLHLPTPNSRSQPLSSRSHQYISSRPQILKSSPHLLNTCSSPAQSLLNDTTVFVPRFVYVQSIKIFTPLIWWFNSFLTDCYTWRGISTDYFMILYLIQYMLQTKHDKEDISTWNQ